jgi:tetratricopeptide (TPR) repeat protein
MKKSICLLVFGLQVSTVWAAPQSWIEWVSEGKASVGAGNYQAGIDAFHKALATGENSKIPARQLVEITISLAAANAELGLYADSEWAWRQALAMVEKTEGTASLDYAVLLANMLTLPIQTTSSEKDIQTLRRAIIAHRDTDSPRDLAMVRACLANLLMRELKYGEAESLLLDSQADFDRLRASEPQLLATVLDLLGKIRYEQGRFAEALQFHSRSLEILESALGTQHPGLIVTLNDLASAMVKANRDEEAAALYRRAVLICTKTLGPDHPEYGVLLENYSFVLKKLGRKHEAKEIAARAKEILSASDRRNGIGAVVSVSALRADEK